MCSQTCVRDGYATGVQMRTCNCARDLTANFVAVLQVVTRLSSGFHSHSLLYLIATRVTSQTLN